MRAIAATILLTGALLVACDDEIPPQYTSADSPSAIAALAQRFAPLVNIAKDESFYPMSATRYIEGSSLGFDHGSRCKDDKPVAETVNVTDLAAGKYKHQEADPVQPQGDQPYTCQGHIGEERTSAQTPSAEPTGFYLRPTDALRAGDNPQGPNGITAPVYWEHHQDQGRSAYVYWFFYGHNDLANGNKHDGDWERVAVRVDGDKPVGVTFAKHGGSPCMVPWQGSILERSGDHPVVYSANGSHGSYPNPGSTYIVPFSFDERSAGTAWSTWTNVHPVEKEPWWGYRGWWGPQNGPLGFNGPMGPYPNRALKEIFTDNLCEPSFGPATLPAAFEGEWETREPVTQIPVVDPYQMRITLTKDKSSVSYRTTWTDPGSTLECSGSLTPVVATDNSIELHEKIENDKHSNCVKEGTVALSLDGDSLKMAYSSAPAKGKGTLYRRNP